VHAVLPHPPHRRRSPPAFGLPASPRRVGSTTIPDKVISPNWFGDWKVITDQPNARDRRWRLLMNSASRIRAYPSGKTSARSSPTPSRSPPRARSCSSGSASGGAKYASMAPRWPSTRSPGSRAPAGPDQASPRGQLVAERQMIRPASCADADPAAAGRDRYRIDLVGARGAEKNRAELLEDAGFPELRNDHGILGAGRCPGRGGRRCHWAS
jgi:hypothetical protein